MTVTSQTLESRVVQVLGPVTFEHDTPGATTGISLGSLPVGAQVLGSLITISEVFNQTSTNVIEVGTDAQFDNFHADAAAGSLANLFVTATAAGGALITTEAEVKAIFVGTGPSGPTTGKATVSLLFIGPQRT